MLPSRVFLLFIFTAVAIILWRYTQSGDDPIAELKARCAEQHLPVRTVVIVPGSDREKRLKLLVPASNRVLIPNTDTWMFCRAHLETP